MKKQAFLVITLASLLFGLMFLTTPINAEAVSTTDWSGVTMHQWTTDNYTIHGVRASADSDNLYMYIDMNLKQEGNYTQLQPSGYKITVGNKVYDINLSYNYGIQAGQTENFNVGVYSENDGSYQTFNNVGSLTRTSSTDRAEFAIPLKSLGVSDQSTKITITNANLDNTGSDLTVTANGNNTQSSSISSSASNSSAASSSSALNSDTSSSNNDGSTTADSASQITSGIAQGTSIKIDGTYNEWDPYEQTWTHTDSNGRQFQNKVAFVVDGDNVYVYVKMTQNRDMQSSEYYVTVNGKTFKLDPENRFNRKSSPSSMKFNVSVQEMTSAGSKENNDVGYGYYSRTGSGNDIVQQIEFSVPLSSFGDDINQSSTFTFKNRMLGDQTITTTGASTHPYVLAVSALILATVGIMALQRKYRKMKHETKNL